jgi:uncharacterized phage protein gp47/JayE
MQSLYDAAFISTSSGSDLDKLVELVGVTRVPAVSSSGVVIFYSVPAPGSDILIPKGTEISTQPDSAGNRIVFTTDADVTLVASTTSIPADVTASVAGLASNVGAGTVTYLATPIFGITSINNINLISGGDDEEDDDTLRERAKQAVEVSGNATVTALRLAVLGVAGVGSVSVDDLPMRQQDNEIHIYLTTASTYQLYHATVVDDAYMQVDGTKAAAPHTFIKDTDYYVDPDNNCLVFQIGGDNPDNSTYIYVNYDYNALGLVDMIVAGTTIPMAGPTLAAVEAVIELRKAAGVQVNVIEPTEVDVDVSCAVTVLSGYTASAVKIDVKNNITNYLDTLEVGYDAYIADLYAVIQNTLGVENSTITLPAADVSIAADEVARAGSIVVS